MAVLSAAEEDLDLIAELTRDKSKVIRRLLTKLKSEYGKASDHFEDDDSELELMTPKEDDLSYNVTTTPTPTKRPGRGKGRSRRGKTRSRATIIKMKRGRARKKQPKPEPPNVTPICVSSMDYDEMTYQVGDIVKVPFSSEDSLKGFAQIQGFFKDQYCEKYVSVRWLIRTTLILHKDYFDPSCFQEGSSHKEPISMRSLTYVMRPPSIPAMNTSHNQREVHLEQKTEHMVEYMDTPTFTLSSSDHKWYQLIY